MTKLLRLIFLASLIGYGALCVATDVNDRIEPAPSQITPLEISVNGTVTVFHLEHSKLHGQAIHIIVSGDDVEAREEDYSPVLQ